MNTLCSSRIAEHERNRLIRFRVYMDGRYRELEIDLATDQNLWLLDPHGRIFIAGVADLGLECFYGLGTYFNPLVRDHNDYSSGVSGLIYQWDQEQRCYVILDSAIRDVRVERIDQTGLILHYNSHKPPMPLSVERIRSILNKQIDYPGGSYEHD